jgi:choline dehydrogenase-like flavoprotein
MIADEFDLVVIGGGIVGTAIADAATARGLHVALIEIGPAELSEQQPATPAVVCRRRPHLGCVAARNHVLGGNGHYWGGGLMRPPGLSLADCLGIADDRAAGNAVDLGSHFAAVERRLGLREPPARAPADLTNGIGEPVLAAEICVLPGRSRNVAATRLARLKVSPRCMIVASATLVGFDSESASEGRRVRALWIVHGGGRSRIVGRRFVIAAGVVDSNLIVQRFAGELLPGAHIEQLGRCLHDHWSVPIADVRLQAGGALRKALAPRFRNGLIVGMHYELPPAPGWGARGFLHFTFAFDEVSPYREIKNLMLFRQQKAAVRQLLGAALPLAGHLPTIARIGTERVLGKRLFLADGIRATATLDFETFPHASNALRLDGDQASFDWEISAEDEASFTGLLAYCRRVISAVEARFSVQMVPQFDWSKETAALEHFRRTATDTYHLGGGLAFGGKTAALDSELRLRGTENLHVVSTAAFARPGIVNPTHCLLALADRFVRN